MKLPDTYVISDLALNRLSQSHDCAAACLALRAATMATGTAYMAGYVDGALASVRKGFLLAGRYCVTNVDPRGCEAV